MSRYLVLSDIHSNLEALEAVLTASSKQKCDGVLVLGDLVGYGADPNAVVDRIRELEPLSVVRGNHDKVAAGLETAEEFNPMARAAAMWTQLALSPDTYAYVRSMPTGPQVVDDAVEICHGSPLDEDLYVVADVDAVRSIERARRPLCFFGHTHVAMRASVDAQRRLEIEAPQGHPEFQTTLVDTTKYLINPGSVGQPRDGDSRAAYAIADIDRQLVTLHRVAYPIETAQKKILEAGLPPMLAYRLGMGRWEGSGRRARAQEGSRTFAVHAALGRLQFLAAADVERLSDKYRSLAGQLESLQQALARRSPSRPDSRS